MPLAIQQPRVRFAPAPTGMMHLGNVRTALINFIFARQKQGSFIVRIEDTDRERNYDPHAHNILHDMAWLGLSYDEGPIYNGPYSPYFQSQRTDIYQAHLDILKDHNRAYPCFCTAAELEQKKERQIALRRPPRYDGTCARLTQHEQSDRIMCGGTAVWRMRHEKDTHITITDLARGSITFDLNHFSDFLLTRSDGGFTFIFANFVDDMLMKITHVFRGEDHLSNTANQAALYKAFNAPLPFFWHLPIICNSTGAKLSKRDFGFSLRDLIQEGYLPEAINNYLAVLGGSFEHEIMSLEEIIAVFPFDRLSATGQIKYDNAKLKWFNQKWIARKTIQELTHLIRPYLREVYGAQIDNLSEQVVENLCTLIKTDLVTLRDSIVHLAFYFHELDHLTRASYEAVIDQRFYTGLRTLIAQHINLIDTPAQFLDALKKSAATLALPLKEIFYFLRLSLIGNHVGPALADIVTVLGTDRSRERIKQGLILLG